MPQENSHETMTDTRNVLITGATRGLGLAISKRLLSEGFRVIGVARKPTAEFSDLASADGQGHFVPFDIEQIDGLFQSTPSG